MWRTKREVGEMVEAKLEYQMISVAGGLNSRLRASATLAGIVKEDRDLLQLGKDFCADVMQVTEALNDRAQIKRNFALVGAIREFPNAVGFSKSVKRIQQIIDALLKGERVSSEEKDEAEAVLTQLVNVLDREIRTTEEKVRSFMSVRI